MPVAATNTSANSALFYLNRNSDNQESALNRVSSGSRITNSADDAAGLAVSDALQSDITSLETASQTAQQAEALLQVADGGLARIGEILQRMKALATQYNSGTLDAASQGFINNEYTALVTQLGLVATSTDYNGLNLIDGTGADQTVVLGVAAADAITIALSGYDADAAALGLAANISGTGDIATIDTAIGTVSGLRATVGAVTSAVRFQGENIDTQITNLKAARSAIFDADIAKEQTDFTSYQVLTEAAIASLSQANQAKQSLLTLLR